MNLLSLGSEILLTSSFGSDCVQLLDVVKISFVCLNTLSLNNSYYFIYVFLNFLLDLLLLGVEV